MKKAFTLILTLLFALAGPTAADEYAYITVSQTSGNVDFSVEKIQKITFDASNMNVVLTDGSVESLPLSMLRSMFFSTNPTDIDNLVTGKDTFAFSGGTLRVKGAGGQQVTLYNMKGEVLTTVTTGEREAAINLSGLKTGVYIVKVGNETRKVMTR